MATADDASATAAGAIAAAAEALVMRTAYLLVPLAPKIKIIPYFFRKNYFLLISVCLLYTVASLAKLEPNRPVGGPVAEFIIKTKGIFKTGHDKIT